MIFISSINYNFLSCIVPLVYPLLLFTIFCEIKSNLGIGRPFLVYTDTQVTLIS